MYGMITSLTLIIIIFFQAENNYIKRDKGFYTNTTYPLNTFFKDFLFEILLQGCYLVRKTTTKNARNLMGINILFLKLILIKKLKNLK